MLIAISGKIGSGKDLVGSIIQSLTDKTISEGEVIELAKGELINPKPELGGWKIKKFADKLKDIVVLLTGCTREDLESQEFKKQQLGVQWNWHKDIISDSERNVVFVRNAIEEGKKYPFPNGEQTQTYREMLQRVGTEAMRNQIHENVWVNALFADYKDKKVNHSGGAFHTHHSYQSPNWIITDTRFPNEAKAIKERHGILIRVERDYVLRNAPEDPSKQHPSETALDSYVFDYTIVNDGTIEELVEKVKEILIKEKVI